MSSQSHGSLVTRGILLMVTAMFFLTAMDSVIKHLSGSYSEFQLVWVRYAGQTVVAVAFVAFKAPHAFRTRNPGMQVLRSLFLFVASVLFFVGLANIGLAAATAILQSSPIMVAVAAYFLLGESFGIRKTLGVLAGLAGVIVIIRPGTEVFDPYALFPLAAAVGFTGYAVVTKMLSKREEVWTSFLYTALLGCLIASFFAPFFWTPPNLADAGLMVLVGLLGSIGQFCVIRSLFLAEASTVVPFGYASLVFSAGFGMAFFSEFPDFWTYVGAAIVTGSGLYIWHRETRAAKQRR